MALKKAQFVNSLPEGVCPNCNQGGLKNTDFKSKKGEMWEQRTCDFCSERYMKSKPRGKPATGQPNTSNEKIDRILEGIITIYKKLANIEELLKTPEVPVIDADDQ